jgi:hypothetical protein
MLHISNDTFRTTNQDEDRLARAFLEILTEDTERLTGDELELSIQNDPVADDAAG